METEKNEPLVVPTVSLQMKLADLYVQTEKNCSVLVCRLTLLNLSLARKKWSLDELPIEIDEIEMG